MKTSKNKIKSLMLALVLSVAAISAASARVCFLPDSTDCGSSDVDIPWVPCKYSSCPAYNSKYQTCYTERIYNNGGTLVECKQVKCNISKSECEAQEANANNSQCCNFDSTSGCYYMGGCPKQCDRNIYDSEKDLGEGYNCYPCKDKRGTFYNCTPINKECSDINSNYSTSCSDSQIAKEVEGVKDSHNNQCYTCESKPTETTPVTITVQYSLDMGRQNSSSWLDLTFKVLSASDAKSHHVELTFNPMDGAEPTNCTISYPLTFGDNTKTKVQCGSNYSMMNTPELTSVSVDNSNVSASVRLDQLNNSTVKNDNYIIKFTKAADINPDDNVIEITALSCSMIDETPSYKDMQTFYAFIYNSEQSANLNAKIFIKDLVSGQTDDNDAGVFTSDEVNINNITYSSGCPGGSIATTTKYYKKDYNEDGTQHKAGDYKYRDNITDVKFFMDNDDSNLISTGQSIPFPFYDTDHTPAQSAEFTYNGQKYRISAVKKEVSNVNYCDEGWSSDKPSDNVFIYTRNGSCYKATGCVENGIVSATKAASVKNSLRWKNSDPTAMTHTSQTCYINWPTNIEFYIETDLDNTYSSNRYPIWPTSSSGIFWKRSGSGQKVNVSSIKDKFYLRSVNAGGEIMTYAIYFKGYYCAGDTSYGPCDNKINLSWPDNYVNDFGDEILPGVSMDNPLIFKKGGHYVGPPFYDTIDGGFVNGDEVSASSVSVENDYNVPIIYKPNSYPTKENDTMTVCYILEGDLDDVYADYRSSGASDLELIKECRDIDIIPYVKAYPEYPY